jgi:hypothetical protein
MRSLQCGYEPFQGYNDEFLACLGKLDRAGLDSTSSKALDYCRDTVLRKAGLIR